MWLSTVGTGNVPRWLGDITTTFMHRRSPNRTMQQPRISGPSPIFFFFFAGNNSKANCWTAMTNMLREGDVGNWELGLRTGPRCVSLSSKQRAVGVGGCEWLKRRAPIYMGRLDREYACTRWSFCGLLY